MSEKRNIRYRKRRLITAKYKLRRKLYKAFCKDPDVSSEMRDKHRYKLSKLPSNSSFARVETDVFPWVALVRYMSSSEFLVSFFKD